MRSVCCARSGSAGDSSGGWSGSSRSRSPCWAPSSGILIGIVFGVSLIKALSDQGLDVLAVPWLLLVVFVVIAAVIGVLAAWLPARRAAKLNVLQAITTE